MVHVHAGLMSTGNARHCSVCRAAEETASWWQHPPSHPPRPPPGTLKGSLNPEPSPQRTHEGRRLLRGSGFGRRTVRGLSFVHAAPPGDLLEAPAGGIGF